MSDTSWSSLLVHLEVMWEQSTGPQSKAKNWKPRAVSLRLAYASSEKRKAKLKREKTMLYSTEGKRTYGTSPQVGNKPKRIYNKINKMRVNRWS